MTAACYDWLTRSAKLTETTEAWLASCSAKERLGAYAGWGAMPDMTAGERVVIFVICNFSVPVA